MTLSFTRWIPISLLASLLVAACGGSETAVKEGTSEQRYTEGQARLADEDYIEARQLFQLIVTQDPASEYADDAQFYLAETYFRNEEYRLAAFEYNRLRQNFPNSPYYKSALFQASESYYHSSLKFDRDQRDTKFAIDQYRYFTTYYPGDSLASTAQNRIRELRSKLAQKDYSVAEQYVILEDFEAALIYYDRVIADYPDTEYHELATIGKIKALRELQRSGEAIDTADKFMKDKPSSPARPQIQQLKNELQDR